MDEQGPFFDHIVSNTKKLIQERDEALLRITQLERQKKAGHVMALGFFIVGVCLGALLCPAF